MRKLTRAQYQALENIVRNETPMCTREEYEAASPYHREKMRRGFDEAGEPIIRSQSMMCSIRIARALAETGLVVVTYRHRDYAMVLPSERGRALINR